MSAIVSTGELDALLTVLGEHAITLGVTGPQPPSRVRLSTGDVVVELDWPAGAAPSRVPPSGAVHNGARQSLVGRPDRADRNGSAPDGAPLHLAVSDGMPPRPAGPDRGAPADPTTLVVEHQLTSPTVGVIYHSPEPGAPPFVGEGDPVAAGQQVAIVEAMKLMIPVEADRAGRVAAILCDDGTSVEFGQPLFMLADA